MPTVLIAAIAATVGVGLNRIQQPHQLAVLPTEVRQRLIAASFSEPFNCKHRTQLRRQLIPVQFQLVATELTMVRRQGPSAGGQVLSDASLD